MQTKYTIIFFVNQKDQFHIQDFIFIWVYTYIFLDTKNNVNYFLFTNVITNCNTACIFYLYFESVINNKIKYNMFTYYITVSLIYIHISNSVTYKPYLTCILTIYICVRVNSICYETHTIETGMFAVCVYKR